MGEMYESKRSSIIVDVAGRIRFSTCCSISKLQRVKGDWCGKL